MEEDHNPDKGSCEAELLGVPKAMPKPLGYEEKSGFFRLPCEPGQCPKEGPGSMGANSYSKKKIDKKKTFGPRENGSDEKHFFV